VWDECIEVPHATKSVWDESHTSHTVPAPMLNALGKKKMQYFCLIIMVTMLTTATAVMC